MIEKTAIGLMKARCDHERLCQLICAFVVFILAFIQFQSGFSFNGQMENEK